MSNTTTFPENQALPEQDVPPSFLINPCRKDAPEREKRFRMNSLEKLRRSLDTEPEGVIVIRDTDGEGPETLPESQWVRGAISENCEVYVVISGDSGALLPADDRQTHDWMFGEDMAAVRGNKPHRYWECYVFTPAASAERWTAFLTFHNSSAWIARIDKGRGHFVQVPTDEWLKEMLPRTLRPVPSPAASA